MTGAPKATSTRHAAGMHAVDMWLIENGRTLADGRAAHGAVAVYAAAITAPTLAPPPVFPMPWRLRVPYAWRALTGRIRPVGEIDETQLLSSGWVEGRVRVQVRRPAKAPR